MTTIAQPLADRSTLLRRAIQADAAISGACGVATLAGGASLAAFTGLPAAAILPLGLIMVGWAAWLAYLSALPTIGRRVAWAIIIANSLWVVESLVVLFSGWVPLTQAGWWIVAAQALVVDMFVVAQYLGLRRAS